MLLAPPPIPTRFEAQAVAFLSTFGLMVVVPFLTELAKLSGGIIGYLAKQVPNAFATLQCVGVMLVAWLIVSREAELLFLYLNGGMAAAGGSMTCYQVAKRVVTKRAAMAKDKAKPDAH